MLGETISHYQILDRLGRGAMGVIYRAVDTTLGRQVALKFLPDGILNRTPAAPSGVHFDQADPDLELVRTLKAERAKLGG
jgi:serine/threonine protein kinase